MEFFPFQIMGGLYVSHMRCISVLNFEPYLTTRKASFYGMRQVNVQLEKHQGEGNLSLIEIKPKISHKMSWCLKNCIFGRPDRDDDLFDEMRCSNQDENLNARK